MDETKSESLKSFITNQRTIRGTILPSLVCVTKSTDKHIKPGDVLNIKTISERYTVEYDNTTIKQQMHAFVPDDLGGLIVVSQFPANHVYPSFYDVFQDFPASVRLLDDLSIQDTVLQSGDELRLKRLHKLNGKDYIICLHVKSRRDFLVPLDVKGRFQRLKDDYVYTVKDLHDRMPVSVKRDPNIGKEMKELHELYLPGLPFANPMILMKSGAVHVDHWYQPGILDICTMNGVKELILSCEKNLEVRQINYSDYLGPIQHLSLVSHGLVGMVSGDEDDVDYDKRLPPKSSAVIIDGSEVKKGVVLRGMDSFLLVPKDYCKDTLFRMRGKEYKTPQDLWEANYTGLVIATQAVLSPTGYPMLSSIYPGDNITLQFKNSQHKKLKVVSNEQNNHKRQAVKLIRSLTNERGSLGKILVDSKAVAHFEEKTAVLGSHRLSNILRHGRTIPIDIALANVSQVAGISDNDMILLRESPFTVIKECDYTVINVTTLHTNQTGDISRKQTFQVPTFVKYHLRISKESHISRYNPVDLGVVEKAPQSFVWKLSPTEYKVIVGAEMADSYRQKYETYIDSAFSPQTDVNDRLSQLLLDPIRHPSPLTQSLSSLDFSSLPHRRPEQNRALHRRHQSTPSRELPAVPILQQSHSESRECQQIEIPPTLPPKSNALAEQQPPQIPTGNQSWTPKAVQSEGHRVIETPPQLPLRGYANTQRLRRPSAPVPSKQDMLPNTEGRTKTRASSESDAERQGTKGTLKPIPKPRGNPTNSQFQHTNTSQLSDGASTDTDGGQSKDYLTPFVISDDSVPKVQPPQDGNIASFTYIQMAGMLRHLDFNDHAIINCVNNKVDGQKLMQIFRQAQSDEKMCQELKLEKLSEVYSLRHIVSTAQQAEAIPRVKPPEDGNISNFSVQQLAGLFKFLQLNEHAVTKCLTEQIDGQKLCNMDKDVMCNTLGIEENKSYSLQYFISQSRTQQSNEI